MSNRGLSSDKVAKVNFGRRYHIAIAKSKAEVDVKNGKHAMIGRALRESKAEERSPDAGLIFQCKGVEELPQIKISQKNDRQSRTRDHFYPRNNDGGRKR